MTEDPNINTLPYYETDGEIHRRMKKPTNLWLKENIPLIIESEYQSILPDVQFKYEDMTNLAQNMDIILKYPFYSIFQLGGFSDICYLIVFALYYSILSLLCPASGLDHLIVFHESDENIIKSFKSRVSMLTRENLHIMLKHKLGKGLRKYHRNIYRNLLPSMIQNMCNSVDVTKREKHKLVEKQSDIQNLLSKMSGCQNNVTEILTIV